MRIKHRALLLQAFIFINGVFAYLFQLPMYRSVLKLPEVNGWQVDASFFLMYTVLFFGLYYFVLGHVGRHRKLLPFIANAVLYGVVVFSVFTCANLGIYMRWTTTLMLKDVVWGGFVCGLISVLAYWLHHFDNKEN